MKQLTVVFILILLAACGASATEKRLAKEIDNAAFIKETQVTLVGPEEDHMAIVWWIPQEFWQSIMARDMTTSDADKEALLKAVSGVSLLAVVQSDVSTFGSFAFYTKEEVERNLIISYTNSDGTKKRLSPMMEIDPDLEIILAAFSPIFASAMGNMGSNFHFFVLNDMMDLSGRSIDPYRFGSLNIKLTSKKGGEFAAKLVTPINSLFVPRKCPNGEDAHVTWKFCPWTGEELAD